MKVGNCIECAALGLSRHVRGVIRVFCRKNFISFVILRFQNFQRIFNLFGYQKVLNILEIKFLTSPRIVYYYLNFLILTVIIKIEIVFVLN